MKNIRIIILVLTSLSAFSQSRNWITENSKDGKSIVKYELVKEQQGTHFYYIAQTHVNTTLDELDIYFSNISNHKNFLERTPKSEEIKKISNNEWLCYYFFDAPWPMADSDVVAKINRTKNDNKLIFTANAITNNYKKGVVDRLTNYKFIYEFEKVNDKTTKITLTADYVPVGSVPNFLIKTWFPEGPAKIVSNLGLMK
jgi:hypothetical protein